MSIFRIDLRFRGENFTPRSVVHKLRGEVNIIDSHEMEDIPQHKLSKKVRMIKPREPYGYGNLTFQHPLTFGLKHNGTTYEDWYVDIVENNVDIMKEYGADEIRLEIDVFYVSQCFIEVLDSKNLRRLFKSTDMRLSFPMNVYKLEEETEIEEMLIDAGYSKSFVNDTLY